MAVDPLAAGGRGVGDGEGGRLSLGQERRQVEDVCERTCVAGLHDSREEDVEAICDALIALLPPCHLRAEVRRRLCRL